MLYLIYLSLLLILWRTSLWQPRELPDVKREAPLLLGHRGVRGLRPENTLAAVSYALEAGLDGVEVDLQRLADGAIVLFHDDETSGVNLKNISLETFRELEPQAPTLDKLFGLVKRYPNTLLNLELKTQGWSTNGLERATIRALHASKIAGRTLISSFNPLSLLRVRLFAPKVRVGLLYAPDLPSWLRSGWLAAWLHVDALHPFESLVDAKLMRRAQRRGLMVNTWTVNDQKRITSLQALQVTAIIGDDPARLLAHKAG